MTSPSRSAFPWALAAFALALGAATAAIAVHPIGDPDTFFHLTLGRAVWAHRALTFPDPTSLPAFTDPVTAPVWLWELATYGVYRLGGWRALAELFGVLGAGSAALIVLLVSAAAGDEARRLHRGAIVLVASLVMVPVLSRMTQRPQVACDLFLPLFLLALFRYFAVEDAARRRWLGALAGLQLLWAQLHGSFVLGPGLFVLALATQPDLRRQLTAPLRRTHLVTLLLLLCALLTSSFRQSFIGYIAEHATGDAVRHIEEMRPPTWAQVSPSLPHGAAYLALVLLALAGPLLSRRIRRTELALAAFGWMLFASAMRFNDASAILMAPAATQGAVALAALVPRWRVLVALAAAVSGAWLFWFSRSAEHWWGPLATARLSEARLPVAAAALLQRMPPGQALLTNFELGSPLGFFLDGRSRNYVDGRTPLVFDDSDYGMARDLWHHPRAILRGVVRYRFTAAVAARDTALCRLLARRWVPVMVEAGYATFLPAGTDELPALTHLSPCSDGVFVGDLCADGGAATDAELAWLASVHASPYLALRRAEVAARCRRPAAELEALLPSRATAWDYPELWEHVAARVAVAAGRSDEALRWLEGPFADGEEEAIEILAPILDGLPRPRARALLERATRSLDDQAPPELRARLAVLCMQDGDAECVRFHGLRALAHGVPEAIAPVRWLSTHHPSDRVRTDALEWLGTGYHKQVSDR